MAGPKGPWLILSSGTPGVHWVLRVAILASQHQQAEYCRQRRFGPANPAI